MRAIWAEEEMEIHFNSAVQEATAAFGTEVCTWKN